jgi:hypothetical protein
MAFSNATTISVATGGIMSEKITLSTISTAQ